MDAVKTVSDSIFLRGKRKDKKEVSLEKVDTVSAHGSFNDLQSGWF